MLGAFQEFGSVPLDRRHFLRCLAVAATSSAMPRTGRTAAPGIGPLRSDPGGLLDLPAGFSYRIVSRAGEIMSDGLRVPFAHDGMAAFPREDGRVTLVCNHELKPAQLGQSAFSQPFDSLAPDMRERVYDRGRGLTPGCGGTTTKIYNPATGRTDEEYLSLAGTEINCAGGPTPWGSWLSCEECFTSPGTAWSAGRLVHREQRHGYVFEVPAQQKGLAEPVPIKAMGRFEHEACAVHAKTGIVYMTEDRHHSLFYRFIPSEPGRLQSGGRLQALAIRDAPSFETHNWSDEPDIRPGQALKTRWIDLDNVDGDDNDLRQRGAAAGAASFARGEGLCASTDELVFSCTIGGRARLGQVFVYRPGTFEGSRADQETAGELTLLAEATQDSVLRNADNLTMALWGDLIVCEDTSNHCGLVGVRPDGSQYQIADNPYSNSELAGVCFAPDGGTLFVNIQNPGTTLAITGPFPA